MEHNRMPRYEPCLGNVMDHEIKISTWNVRTLKRIGAKQDLENVLQR